MTTAASNGGSDCETTNAETRLCVDNTQYTFDITWILILAGACDAYLTATQCELLAGEFGVNWGGIESTTEIASGCYLDGTTMYYNTVMEKDCSLNAIGCLCEDTWADQTDSEGTPEYMIYTETKCDEYVSFYDCIGIADSLNTTFVGVVNSAAHSPGCYMDDDVFYYNFQQQDNVCTLNDGCYCIDKSVCFFFV